MHSLTYLLTYLPVGSTENKLNKLNKNKNGQKPQTDDDNRQNIHHNTKTDIK